MRIEPRQRLLSLAPLSLAASLLAASGSVSSQTDVSVLPVNAHTSRRTAPVGACGDARRRDDGSTSIRTTCVTVGGPTRLTVRQRTDRSKGVGAGYDLDPWRRIMRNNAVKDGWQRFLDRLRRLWGKRRVPGFGPAART